VNNGSATNTTMAEDFSAMLDGSAPILALAPMHDITDLGFWRLLCGYGGADLYFTEYLRVHCSSRLTPRVLRAIDENPTGKPVVAQLFGNDVPAMVRAARELRAHAVSGIDLNLGCPAPMVTRKHAGGGLLRQPQRVDALVGALRDAVHVRFSVKTRLGYAAPEELEALLSIFARHSLDLLTLHGRTVTQGYGGAVRYDLIAEAVRRLPCPVLANGDIDSADRAAAVLAATGAKGVMIGRGAVRNPWIFTQIRQRLAGTRQFVPRGHDVLAYVRELFATVSASETREEFQVRRAKRCMNFLGEGIDHDGRFLARIRRAHSRADFFAACDDSLAHERPMPLVAPTPQAALSSLNRRRDAPRR
jgi:nifR3 family TIM-barrel protein